MVRQSKLRSAQIQNSVLNHLLSFVTECKWLKMYIDALVELNLKVAFWYRTIGYLYQFH